MFSCLPEASTFPGLLDGPASTYNNPAARSAYPSQWDQYAYDQRHNPVFPGNNYTNGTFWAAPITGLDMLRALEASAKLWKPRKLGVAHRPVAR